MQSCIRLRRTVSRLFTFITDSRRRIALYGAVSLIVLAGVLVAQPVRADTGQLYLVRAVPAVGDGKTDQAALRQAALRAAPAALNRMLRRLIRKRDHQRIPRVGAVKARAMASGLEVFRAKRLPSAKGRRFEGALSFQFDSKKLAAFLETTGLAWSTRRSKPALVLAVWRKDTRTVLWDTPNPWRTAWETVALPAGLVPLVLPDGTLGDLQAINGAQAFKGDVEPILAIAARYEVGRVLIVVAQDDGKTIRIAASIFDKQSGRIERLMTVSIASREKMASAVAAIVSGVEERWKARVIVPAGPVQRLGVTARFVDIASWTAIRENLKAAPDIVDYRIRGFSAGEAGIMLRYRGQLDGLPGRLEKFGLLLMKEEGSNGEPVWILRVRTKPGSGGD